MQPGTSVQVDDGGIAGDTGEMIEEMMRHGAAIAQMEERVGCNRRLPPGAEEREFKPTGVQGGDGRAARHPGRSERCALHERGRLLHGLLQAMLERHKVVPAVPSWAVFDSQYLRKYMLAGSAVYQSRSGAP
jgi:3-oxosteroid 1-dehydrogenase